MIALRLTFSALLAVALQTLSAVASFSAPQVHGDTFVPDHVLRLTYANVSIACEYRESVLINGSIPGPELRLQAGKPTWIRVYNDMHGTNTTIHWHGLAQKAAMFSDGTPSAAQWPIPALHYFDYEVFPAADDAGSYFYHSHVGFQMSTASGPLIVEDPGKPPYDYDEEIIVQYQDYFKKPDHAIAAGLTKAPFLWSGETSAVLINGVGVSEDAKAGKDGCQLPVINVEAGKTYRMRFIGTTALSMVQLAITEHNNFTIVAADGQYTKPHTENLMQVSTGQRFDVIFQAKSQAEIGVTTDFLMQFETKDRPAVYYGYGVLRYSGGTPNITTGPAKPPFTLTNATYNWAEYALEPLTPNGFPSASEVTRRIILHARQLYGSSFIYRINGDQWNISTIRDTPADKPYLVNIYENGTDAIPNYEAAIKNKGWDPVTYAYPARIGEVLEIILQNTGSLVHDNGGVDFHPFHAHGGHYFDIGSGNGTYNATENEKKLQGYNPVLRDTTNLYRYEAYTKAGINAGWRGWRLRVQDPGVWMIHCHTLQHMIMGMQTVWVMGDYDQIAAYPEPYVSGYLTFGGSAYGNESYAPRVLHQFEH